MTVAVVCEAQKAEEGENNNNYYKQLYCPPIAPEISSRRGAGGRVVRATRFARVLCTRSPVRSLESLQSWRPTGVLLALALRQLRRACEPISARCKMGNKWRCQRRDELVALVNLH